MQLGAKETHRAASGREGYRGCVGVGGTEEEIPTPGTPGMEDMPQEDKSP